MAKSAGLYLTIILVAIILFWQTLSFDFAYDDFYHIHQHSLVTSQDITFSTILFPFFEATFPGDLFRPIAVLSYRLNYIFAELNPASYHAVNLILHIFCSLLVFTLTLTVLRNKWVAFVSALFFAVHPIHIEAVANIIGRAELLSCFFILASLLLFRIWSSFCRSFKAIFFSVF